MKWMGGGKWGGREGIVEGVYEKSGKEDRERKNRLIIESKIKGRRR